MKTIKNNWKQIVFVVVAVSEVSIIWGFANVVQYVAAMAVLLAVTYAAQHWDAF